MSLLLIRVVNRLGCESAKADNSLIYKKISVLAHRTSAKSGKSIIEAPEKIHSSLTLIATTTAHFQAAVNAVFEPNGGATILPELAPHRQKEILRHIASYLEATTPHTLTRADFDGIKPERPAKGLF